MVAYPGKETCTHVNQRWASGDAAARREVNHAGHLLHRHCHRFLGPDVGLHEGGGAPVGRIYMEYAIAGITAVLLFIYLMYALLRPERF